MKCYKAKWIITATGEVLEDKAIVVDEGKFTEFLNFDQTSKFDKQYVKDLGNCVITPGFIDLLTQYQYTDIFKTKSNSLKSKFKRTCQNIAKTYNFAGVKSNTFSRKWADILSEYFIFDRNQKLSSFKNGVINAIKSGTTCIAQVSKEDKYFNVINKLPVKNFLFFEVYADSSDNSKRKFKELREKIENYVLHKSENTHIGVMLHSISAVHKKMWELFSKYCRKHNMLMMTRLAESKEEIEWLEYNFSDIDILHKFMGFKKFTPYEKNVDAIEYLNKLKVLTKSVIVVNANYIENLEKLAATGVKFVYQPKYSDEICNKKHDINEIVKYFPENFGFSSQSFANEKEYSLLKVAAETNCKLNITELIKYLTIYPAKILRLDNLTGTIEIGKDADFNVFKLDEGEDYNDLIKKSIPYSTYSKGRKIVKRGEIRFSI